MNKLFFPVCADSYTHPCGTDCGCGALVYNERQSKYRSFIKLQVFLSKPHDAAF